jgi:hypothetical protein
MKENIMDKQLRSRNGIEVVWRTLTSIERRMVHKLIEFDALDKHDLSILSQVDELSVNEAIEALRVRQAIVETFLDPSPFLAK